MLRAAQPHVRWLVGIQSILIAAASCGAPAGALAEESDSEVAPVVASAHPKQDAPDAVVVANIGLGWLRPSIDLEFPFATHHSIVLTGTEQFGSTANATIGEVSYRVYPLGAARRLFVGVAPFVGSTRFHGTISGVPIEGTGAFYGVGVDIGWRWIFRNGVAMGAGFGVQAQHSSVADKGVRQDEGDFDLTMFEGTKSGIVPRIRFDIGWVW